MITGATITDEQIGKLLTEYLGRKPFADSYGVDLCDEALGRPSRYKQPAMRRTPDAAAIAKARARCAEILNAITEPTCDFHWEHDQATDTPTGERCGMPASHRIDWEDGRHSFACGGHLEIDDTASVKPVRTIPLNESYQDP